MDSARVRRIQADAEGGNRGWWFLRVSTRSEKRKLHLKCMKERQGYLRDREVDGNPAMGPNPFDTASACRSIAKIVLSPIHAIEDRLTEPKSGISHANAREPKDSAHSPNVVQSQVPLDVIRKVVGISRFPTICHSQVRSKCFDLVLI
jgi:hypothetical protein